MANFKHMVDNINWSRTREMFEAEMTRKLEKLPGHRKVLESRKRFRGMISHELPETAPAEIYSKLISMLLSGDNINEEQIKKEIIDPEVQKEKYIIKSNKLKFEKIRESTRKWFRIICPRKNCKFNGKSLQPGCPEDTQFIKIRIYHFRKLRLILWRGITL